MIGLQNFNTWKIQLPIAINFISSKGTEEKRIMHSRSDNIKFTCYSDANKVIDELFESLSWRYTRNLETSMTGSVFIFDSDQLMH